MARRACCWNRKVRQRHFPEADNASLDFAHSMPLEPINYSSFSTSTNSKAVSQSIQNARTGQYRRRLCRGLLTVEANGDNISWSVTTQDIAARYKLTVIQSIEISCYDTAHVSLVGTVIWTASQYGAKGATRTQGKSINCRTTCWPCKGTTTGFGISLSRRHRVAKTAETKMASRTACQTRKAASAQVKVERP